MASRSCAMYAVNIAVLADSTQSTAGNANTGTALWTGAGSSGPRSGRRSRHSAHKRQYGSPEATSEGGSGDVIVGERPGSPARFALVALKRRLFAVGLCRYRQFDRPTFASQNVVHRHSPPSVATRELSEAADAEDTTMGRCSTATWCLQ